MVAEHVNVRMGNIRSQSFFSTWSVRLIISFYYLSDCESILLDNQLCLTFYSPEHVGIR